VAVSVVSLQPVEEDLPRRVFGDRPLSFSGTGHIGVDLCFFNTLRTHDTFPVVVEVVVVDVAVGSLTRPLFVFDDTDDLLVVRVGDLLDRVHNIADQPTDCSVCLLPVPAVLVHQRRDSVLTGDQTALVVEPVKGTLCLAGVG